MKLKSLLIIGASIMLAGCGGDQDDSSEEGVGTMNSDSENQETVSEDTVEEENDASESGDQENSNDAGLLDLSDTDPGWINYEGERGGSSDYQTTPPIEYDASLDYELSVGAYVAYFNGDEFITTVQQESAGPIEQVEEADTIRVSYHTSFEERVSLEEE